MNNYHLDFISDNDIFQHVKHTVLKYRFQISKCAFKKLCTILPKIIEDVVQESILAERTNTVIDELQSIDENLLKSIYLLSFKKYEGFHDFTL